MDESCVPTPDSGAGVPVLPHPLSVAHVVLSLELGGLERLVLDLVREGRASGQKADVICLESPGRLAPAARALGASVVCVNKRPGIQPETAGRIRAALAALRPDVVHTHQLGALFYAGPVAGVPVVHTEHGKAVDDRPRRRWLGRVAGCFAARYCCVSQDIAAEVLARRIVPARKVIVVPNGIDLSRFHVGASRVGCRETLGIPAEAPVVGTVGRLSEIKRQDHLIRAFGRALGRAPEAHLLIVGEGPLGGELRKLADGLGFGDRVHFAGYQPRPEEYLAEMDVFALSSRSEGMPLAVLEAWAAGLPVVATNVGGLPELIQDGQTGILVDTNDEASLAEALAGLIADPARARQLGDRGRRRVEADYDLSRTSQAYQHIHLDLACAGRAGPTGQIGLHGRERSCPGDDAI